MCSYYLAILYARGIISLCTMHFYCMKIGIDACVISYKIAVRTSVVALSSWWFLIQLTNTVTGHNLNDPFVNIRFSQHLPPHCWGWACTESFQQGTVCLANFF